MAQAPLSLDELPRDLLGEILVALSDVDPFLLPRALALVSMSFNKLSKQYFGMRKIRISVERFLPGLTLPFQRLLSSTPNGAVLFFDHLPSFPLLLALNKALTKEVVIDMKGFYEPFHQIDSYGGGFPRAARASVSLQQLDDIVALFPSLHSLELRHCDISLLPNSTSYLSSSSTIPTSIRFPNLSRLDRFLVLVGKSCLPVELLQTFPLLRDCGDVMISSFSPGTSSSPWFDRLNGICIVDFEQSRNIPDASANAPQFFDLLRRPNALKELSIFLYGWNSLQNLTISFEMLSSLQRLCFFSLETIQIAEMPNFAHLRELRVSLLTVELFTRLPRETLELLTSFEFRTDLFDESADERTLSVLETMKCCKSLLKFRFYPRTDGIWVAEFSSIVGNLPLLRSLCICITEDAPITEMLSGSPFPSLRKIAFHSDMTYDLDSIFSKCSAVKSLRSIKVLVKKPSYRNFTLLPLLSLPLLHSLSLCIPVNQRELDTCMAHIPNIDRFCAFLPKLKSLRSFSAYLDHRGAAGRWREALRSACPSLDSIAIIESYTFRMGESFGR